jgi:peptidoglycan hydrolase-like protein with peptidoglycan-binding domain
MSPMVQRRSSSSLTAGGPMAQQQQQQQQQQGSTVTQLSVTASPMAQRRQRSMSPMTQRQQRQRQRSMIPPPTPLAGRARVPGSPITADWIVAHHQPTKVYQKRSRKWLCTLLNIAETTRHSANSGLLSKTDS